MSKLEVEDIIPPKKLDLLTTTQLADLRRAARSPDATPTGIVKLFAHYETIQRRRREAADAPPRRVRPMMAPPPAPSGEDEDPSV